MCDGGQACVRVQIEPVVSTQTVPLPDSGRRVLIRIEQNRNPCALAIERAGRELNDEGEVPSHDFCGRVHQVRRNRNSRVYKRVADRVADLTIEHRQVAEGAVDPQPAAARRRAARHAFDVIVVRLGIARYQ